MRRKWLDEASYADLIALCQFLPGPSSSQTGIALGISRAGLRGGFAAWLGFTLPSAVLLTLFAYATTFLHGATTAGWLNGLLVVAVAVVAQAVWGMATTLCPDLPRATMALVSAIAILLWPIAIVQITIIVLAGLIGWRLLRKSPQEAPRRFPLRFPADSLLAAGLYSLHSCLDCLSCARSHRISQWRSLTRSSVWVPWSLAEVMSSCRCCNEKWFPQDG